MSNKYGLNILDNLATGINKEDPIINAIISNDKGEGATANELENCGKFLEYYTCTGNVVNHVGSSLELIVKMFSGLKRRMGESDAILLRRFMALTCRKSDVIWGNALNIKHIFESYFNGITCFVAENTNKENLLTNGDFENNDSIELGGGAKIDYKARFSGMYGLLLKGVEGEYCTQVIEQDLLAGVYTFHFMLWGTCGVIIQREDGKYWNANDQFRRYWDANEQELTGDVVMEWVDEEVVNMFAKPDGWDSVFCFLKLPEDIDELTIKYVSIEGKQAFIDYSRLYIKPQNPSYTLLFQFTGHKITEKTLHLGISGNEPIPGLNYLNEAYFDDAFIIGPKAESNVQSFESILDLIKPRGIQVFTEFVEKKEKEQGPDIYLVTNNDENLITGAGDYLIE